MVMEKEPIAAQHEVADGDQEKTGTVPQADASSGQAIEAIGERSLDLRTILGLVVSIQVGSVYSH